MLSVLLLACAPKGPAPLVSAIEVGMPDGIGLAVDVLRPAGGQAAPTVVIQTRYWRSIGLKVRQAPGSLPIVPREAIARALLDAGYNVVVADVRGTGASAGDWPAPWSPAEVADGCALLDWVVAQPWSLPQLATYGTSYEGTTALLAATCGQPALRAVLAREIEWDLTAELLAPGGVANTSFPAIWSAGVDALDHGGWPDFFPQGPRRIIAGVRPLDDDPDRSALNARIAARPPRQVAAAVAGVRRRDDPWGNTGLRAGDLDPAAHVEALAQSSAAIHIWAGWWDGATADGALAAAAALPQARVAIGAWDHEGEAHSSPLRRRDSEPSTVELAALVATLDAAVKGAPPPPHRWYVAGAEGWEQGAALPTTAPQTRFLADKGALSPQQTALSARWEVDFSRGVGPDSRWTAGVLRPIPPFTRRGEPGSRSWTAPAEAAPLRLFGAATLDCAVQASAGDGALFAYLEHIDKKGRATTLTEGVARVTGGPLRLSLRAVAAELAAGEALGLTLTGADAGTFERLPASGPNTLSLSGPCALTLPVRDGGSSSSG